MSQDDAIELLEIYSQSSVHTTERNDRSKFLSPIHDSQKRGHKSAIAASSSGKQKTIKPATSKNSDVAFSEVTSNSYDLTNVTESVLPDSTPKSEMYSYKEKIRERFNLVKKRAGRFADKHSVPTTSKKLSRFDALKKENENIENELSAYISKKSKEIGDANNFNVYVFFTEDSTECEIADTHDELIHNGSEISVLKLTDDTFVNYELPQQLFDSIELAEENLLCYPQQNIGVLNRTWNDKERNLEEEGYYIPKVPKISKRHLKILEQRLLDSDSNIWFRQDGTFYFLPNPKSRISSRPNIRLDTKCELYEYAKANTVSGTCEQIVVHQPTILEFHIKTVHFTHHPLFSTEHVLQQKLFNATETYQSKLNKGNIMRIANRLEVVRHIKKKCELVLKESGDSTTLENKKLDNYSKEIVRLRNQWFNEGKEERELVKLVFKIWKTIKRVREVNNFSSTSVRLAIKKVPCDYVVEKLAFDQKVEEIYKEIIDEYNVQFSMDMKKYKEELQVWKISKNSSPQNLDELNVKKPKKPTRKWNEEQVKKNVTKVLNESFKAPGDPQIYFKIHYDHKITENVENIKEKQRRNAVNSSTIYLKVMCDAIEISKTKTVFLNNNFKCHFDECLSLQLVSIPANLNIEIYEQPNTLMKRKYPHINLPVPPTKVSFKSSVVSERYFIKDEIVHYKHAAVGSGINITEISELSTLYNHDEQSEPLNTEGIICYNLGWDKTLSKFTSFQERKNIEIKSLNDIFTKDGLLNVNSLAKWTEDNQIDPENPKNTVVYEYIKMCSDESFIMNSNKGYFRLNLLQSLQFCSLEDMERNIRFTILQLRNRNVPEFSGMVVSNRLREIPVNVLYGYEQRQIYSKQKYEPENEIEIDSIRSHGKKFLEDIFVKVFQQCRLAQNNLLFNDVVDEKGLANFELLVQDIINKVLNYFTLQSERKNLFSYIMNRKPQIKSFPQESNTSASVKIEVCLFSGTNLTKKNKFLSRKSIGNSFDHVNDTKVTVEVKYGHSSTFSSVADGLNPTWNEYLILPLETSHTDYMNPDSLKGSVVVNVYSKTSIEAQMESGHLNSLVGYIEVPLSAICSCNKMEGLFKIMTPYFSVDQDQKNSKNSLSGKDTQSSFAHHSYLSMKISVKPNLPKLNPNMADWPTNELPYIKEHIMHWNETFNSSFPLRRFSALIIDTNCKTSCITRCIRPLEPPQLNSEGFDVTAEQCLRYVSLIPFTSHNKFYQTVCLTTDQFLKLSVGSVVDHAIALTCYFLTLNLESWLLFGFGIPNGVTAYVLTKEDVNESQILTYYVYDVITACKYRIQDPFCPLQKVFCIINEHNIWANTQRDNSVYNIRFDLTRRWDWCALFNNRIPAPSNTLQLKLNYLYNSNVKDIEMRIDKKIRRRIAKSRKTNPTIFNHSVSTTYKNILKKLELNCLQGKSNLEAHMEVSKTVPSLKVNGIVINLPYTSVSSIVTKVLSFGVHNNETDIEKTECGVSVYVHPYPSHVLSVWVFIGYTLKDNLL